jgi:putative ABC transport system ATP-binding protein
MKIIQTENLTRTYTVGHTTVNALSGVNFEVEMGEFVALMGPSGSGKSTMMHLLGCLDTPTAGRYFLEERDVSKLSKDERARVRNAPSASFSDLQPVNKHHCPRNVELPLLYGQHLAM